MRLFKHKYMKDVAIRITDIVKLHPVTLKIEWWNIGNVYPFTIGKSETIEIKKTDDWFEVSIKKYV